MDTGYFRTASTSCNITSGWGYFHVSTLHGFLFEGNIFPLEEMVPECLLYLLVVF